MNFRVLDKGKIPHYPLKEYLQIENIYGGISQRPEIFICLDIHL